MGKWLSEKRDKPVIAEKRYWVWLGGLFLLAAICALFIQNIERLPYMWSIPIFEGFAVLFGIFFIFRKQLNSRYNRLMEKAFGKKKGK